jgi:DNA uptake protein ComE-like DNA-binding protein
LTALPLIGLAMAKKVVSERVKNPFRSVEDLIERLPTIDWTSLENQISY